MTESAATRLAFTVVDYQRAASYSTTDERLRALLREAAQLRTTVEQQASIIAHRDCLLHDLAIELMEPEQMEALAAHPALIVQAAKNVCLNEIHYRGKVDQQAAEIQRLMAIQESARQIWQQERKTLNAALAEAQRFLGSRVMEEWTRANTAEAALAARPTPADLGRALSRLIDRCGDYADKLAGRPPRSAFDAVLHVKAMIEAEALRLAELDKIDLPTPASLGAPMLSANAKGVEVLAHTSVSEGRPQGSYLPGVGAEDRLPLAVPGDERHCPRCESPAPHLHPAVQYEGEVQLCPHPWHTADTPTGGFGDVLAVFTPLPADEAQALADYGVVSREPLAVPGDSPAITCGTFPHGTGTLHVFYGGALRCDCGQRVKDIPTGGSDEGNRGDRGAHGGSRAHDVGVPTPEVCVQVSDSDDLRGERRDADTQRGGGDRLHESTAARPLITGDRADDRAVPGMPLEVISGFALTPPIRVSTPAELLDAISCGLALSPVSQVIVRQAGLPAPQTDTLTRERDEAETRADALFVELELADERQQEQLTRERDAWEVHRLAREAEIDALIRRLDEARERLRVERLIAVITSRDYVQRLAASETARRAAEQDRDASDAAGSRVAARLTAQLATAERDRNEAQVAVQDALRLAERWRGDLTDAKLVVGRLTTELTEARTSLLDQVLAIVERHDPRRSSLTMHDIKKELAALRHPEGT